MNPRKIETGNGRRRNVYFPVCTPRELSTLDDGPVETKWIKGHDGYEQQQVQRRPQQQKLIAAQEFADKYGRLLQRHGATHADRRCVEKLIRRLRDFVR